MSDRTELRTIWPTLGRGYTAGLNKNKSFTKRGPGRTHRQGK